MANLSQIKVGSTTYDIKAKYDGAGEEIVNKYVKKAGDTMTGDLTLPNLKATGSVLANTSGSTTAGGLGLYGSSPNDYGIAFRGTGYGGKHGFVQGDWATYHFMSGATNRGWVFRHSSSGDVASIDGLGNTVFNGSITTGGNATNTSGCKMQYNSTTLALDFIFS